MESNQKIGYVEVDKPLSEMDAPEIIKLNDSWFERVIDNRRHVERDALLNISFLLDQQYVSVSRVGAGVQLTPIPEKKGRVRTVEQIIEPVVRSEMARLLRTKPQGIVVPLGNDPEDYEAAQAGDDGLAYVIQSHDVEEYMEQACLWMITGGTSHLGWGWDPEKIDENGNQGDYYFRSLSPFEFGVPQLRQWNINEQPYIMVTKAYEVSEIKERWGEAAKNVTADRNEKFSSLDDRLTSILSTSNNQQGSYGGAKERSLPLAIVKETWIKPGFLAPEGAVLVTCAGQILEMKTWPKWCNRRYPFAKLEYFRIPGSYWAKPMINALIPLQRRHNRAASIVVETMNVLSQTRLAAPRNTQVKGILGGKGVMFETPLTATTAVTNISAPPIGDLPFREMDNTRGAVRDISHQHEVSRGTTPPNVRSGTAINALKELDDTASVIPVRSIERAAQTMGRHILSIMQEMWDEPRLIYVLGETGDIETHSLMSGEKVGGQFVVQTGTAYSYSKEERQQQVFRNLEAGLISPEEAIRHQEMGTSRGVLQERDISRRHARRENQKFTEMTAVDPQTGQPSKDFLMQQFQSLLPADWHDHPIHVSEHNKLRMRPTYERWPSWKRALFEAHISGHQAALMAQMETMQGVGAPPPEALNPPQEEQAVPQGA